MLFAMAFSGLYVFSYCYYGQYATDCFEGFIDCLYESNWMKLPNDLQKNYILMIAYAQEPIYYELYGIIDLNLETSLNVCVFFQFLFFSL